MRVITHEGGVKGSRVDLCIRHGQLEIIKSYVGSPYIGVSRGLHEGTCLECKRLGVEDFNDRVLGESHPVDHPFDDDEGSHGY